MLRIISRTGPAINFGNRTTLGETVNIAGQGVPKTGFVVCRRCGKVEESNVLDRPEAFEHTVACPARKSGSSKPLLDYIYLYREFSSEAIRILLPLVSFAGPDSRLQSFIAAIVLGLKHHFRGNIDHLEATVQDEPIPDTTSLQKKYLVLYDRVPGGTGYLKELSQSAQSMMALFEEALAVLQRCECREDPAKDGCYRCVYAYRTSFDMPNISRGTAIQCLTEILQYRDRVIPIDTLAQISQSSFIESELEAYFIEALHRARYNGLPVQLRKDIVHHKTGWYCNINGYGYYIEPQGELSEKDGVPIATRPDFVIYPERQKDGRPIAVYLDGFAHHANTRESQSRVGDDMARRLGLVRSGRFHVWSLTWKDVESRFTDETGFFTPLLKPVSQTQQKLIHSFDKETKVGCLGDVNHLDNFSLLVRLLAEPQPGAWQASAAVQMLVHMDINGCNSDDIALELERLLGDKSEWVAAMCPSADTSGLMQGTLADAATEETAKIELLTWVTTDAIRHRSLEAVQVVCRLRDLGEITTTADFKRAWNGFLRLHNLMQFLPECLFVTEQGLQDRAYQPLEFVFASDTPSSSSADPHPSLAAYADLVASEVLDALGVLATHGVRLPRPDEIPFELCGRHGNIIGQAELAWEDRQIAFVDEGEAESRQAFEQAGWTVHTVAEFVAQATDFAHVLKGDVTP